MTSLQARPRKKPAYLNIHMDGYIIIAGFGSATKYEDESGAVQLLLTLMDGTRTVAEIAEAVCARHAELSQDDVLAAIADMDQDGFLEDMNFVGAEILSPYELKRYHRNINFFSTYANLEQNKYQIQKRLSEARVCLLGLGGLGSHIAYDLAGIGISHLKAVEFDTVDLSNLNRQILYNDADRGLSKAQLAAARIRAFHPHMDFQVLEKQLGSVADIEAAAEGCQFLICVADRPKMMITRWVNEACVRMGIPMLTAGLEAQRAMHYTMIPGQTGCVECWYHQVQKADPLSYAILEEQRRLNLTGDNTAFVPLVSVAGGFVTAELVRLITGIRPPRAAGQLISIDFDTMTTTVAETWERNPDCPICGGHQTT